MTAFETANVFVISNKLYTVVYGAVWTCHYLVLGTKHTTLKIWVNLKQGITGESNAKGNNYIQESKPVYQL